MKDADLLKLFAEIKTLLESAHTKIDAITQGTPQAATAPVNNPNPASTASVTAQPEPQKMNVETPINDPSIKSETGTPGFFSTNLIETPTGDVFDSQINGKPNALVITSIDEDTFITFELFKDYKLSDKTGIQGTLLEVGQKDNTHEIDIENLKVAGMVLVSMSLAMRIRAWDSMPGKTPIDEVIIEFTVRQ